MKILLYLSWSTTGNHESYGMTPQRILQEPRNLGVAIIETLSRLFILEQVFVPVRNAGLILIEGYMNAS
jgi:hypothetical protein